MPGVLDDMPGVLDDMPGVLDLAYLQGVLDLVRESDEAAGDPTGEDGAAYALLEDGEAWPLAELAGTAAEDMTPGAGLAYWASGFAPAQMTDYALPGAAAACRRLASWAQATELALVAEVAARAAARDSGIPQGRAGCLPRYPKRLPPRSRSRCACRSTALLAGRTWRSPWLGG
jgi:hypothetical protein